MMPLFTATSSNVAAFIAQSYLGGAFGMLGFITVMLPMSYVVKKVILWLNKSNNVLQK